MSETKIKTTKVPGGKKRIESYFHRDQTAAQEPDDRPGNYYVSMVDGARFALLLGPFPNDHRGALSRVDLVRQRAPEVDPRATFYGFGTCWLPADYTKPGRLNGLMDPETCVHRWQLESPAGPTSRGVCDFCGKERNFQNSTSRTGWYGYV